MVKTYTQRITATDIANGRIRLPRRAKQLFPGEPDRVRVLLRGTSLEARYNPRLGPDRERSGVLSIGRGRMARLVMPNETLEMSARRNDVRLD